MKYRVKLYKTDENFWIRLNIPPINPVGIVFTFDDARYKIIDAEFVAVEVGQSWNEHNETPLLIVVKEF